MTSNRNTFNHNREAFVWIWLPGETDPVVAGRLEAENGNVLFNYGKSYLGRIGDQPPAIPIYEPELPLQPGVLPLPEGLTMPGCIRDAGPDAWGRRVIINQKLGLKGADTDTAELDELTYLLESGSDRIGALDFQHSPSEYVPRIANNVGLEELLESAERVEKGMPLTPELDQALFRGSSIGGARPKALVQDQGKKYVAKFSSSTDLYSVVKAEFIAMRLAQLAGLNVAPVNLVKAANKDVLLIERFDREPKDGGWSRKVMVSALTLLGLDDMMARYASYETLAEIVRHRFTDPKDTLKELFSRLVFNILCGNTDDHARNHAAFWNGKELTLTPAYDICPQGRTGNEASQAMLISGNNNLSQLKTCLETASNFLLSQDEAHSIFAHLTEAIQQHWDSVCEEAELSEVDRKLFWGRQFLNPFSIH
ncbi:type II toxin-antitoxin system HipA family toxin [Microbulbifer rhizosphaerae]|uniref:Serine/threonine-protein kinase HipA n=1 Tax=Microbulbifer rhizosphaerae TaxID=1562603 RepID=A0A7W4WDU0_9GAMM|nr:HipA domain-containing protein [Microbulbifer rhizosphaerae]MBB3061882.1 serine/threonine-protein kinase HipA [Microbulbifer rhizosphaerae]